MKKVVLVCCFGFLSVFSSTLLHAQTPADIPGGSSAPGTTPTSGDGPAEVPLNANMSIALLVIGIAYASGKFNKKVGITTN